MSGADWLAEQAAVWGDKDPDVWTRVIERVRANEPKMLADVEQAIAAGAPTHTVAWICVNYVLRGKAFPDEE